MLPLPSLTQPEEFIFTFPHLHLDKRTLQEVTNQLRDPGPVRFLPRTLVLLLESTSRLHFLENVDPFDLLRPSLPPPASPGL